MHRLCPILPELNVLFSFISHHISLPYAQLPLLQQIAQWLPIHIRIRQYVFQRALVVKKDLQVVGDDMPVLAVRARDEDGAVVVALLRYPM